MTKIVTILGARPQFIKASAVSRALADHQGVSEVLVHTGQHFDEKMSDVFFEELGIPCPIHQLGIASGNHGAMTGRMLEAVEVVLLEEAPSCVLVYGDTNSTLAGALAAAKLHIPIAHVEAGLRSFNRRMPEEINRVLTDHVADTLFTPTDEATKNLIAEGISTTKVFQVGDVMYDAALHFSEVAAARGAGPGAFGLAPGEYVLATIHRQENTDDTARLEAIMAGLDAVAAEIPVLLPLHPRTRLRLAEANLDGRFPRIQFTPPLGYLDMVTLQQHAAVIATDSGGVQKEAFFHQRPCVTLRDETEWVELVKFGWNRLVPPTEAARITREVLSAIGSRGSPISPYGDGTAALRIVQTCLRNAT